MRIAITGTLVSMTRDEAVRRIADRGATYGESISASVTHLVVGGLGWPLEADGRVTGKLRRARELVRRGHELAILDEERFLELLGVELDGHDVRRHYAPEDLARASGATARQLRSWARLGLLTPVTETDGIPLYDFGEVSRARQLHELLEAGVTPRRLRRALHRLRAWCHDADAAAGRLHLLAHDGRLATRNADGSLVETSGQRLFDFEAETVTPTVGLPVAAPDDLFERAVQLEDDGDYESAAARYYELLTTEGPDADICFNLGNCLIALERFDAAAERFRQAVELLPDFAGAWNNLGNSLVAIGRATEAITAFRRAVAVDPDYADAHYNLADALDQLGRFDEAVAAWNAYLRYETTGDWADYARRRLAECSA